MASISYSTHSPHIRGYKQMVLLILSPDARYITVSSKYTQSRTSERSCRTTTWRVYLPFDGVQEGPKQLSTIHLVERSWALGSVDARTAGAAVWQWEAQSLGGELLDIRTTEV